MELVLRSTALIGRNDDGKVDTKNMQKDSQTLPYPSLF